MRRFLCIALCLVFVSVCAFAETIITISSDEFKIDSMLQGASLTIRKQVVGEIWTVRCDIMDHTTYRAGGTIWQFDPIMNRARKTAKEGHRLDKCGDSAHWIVWVDQQGVACRLDEIKSGATGGTLAATVYQAVNTNIDWDALCDGDENEMLKYWSNFQTPIPYSSIHIGERIFFTTQNKGQVWYHTGVVEKTSPTYLLYLDGEPYPITANGLVTIEDLELGIHTISEEPNPLYYLGDVTVDGDSVGADQWQVTIELDGDSDVNWPNVVKIPDGVVTSTPAPTPTATPTATPAPTDSPAAVLTNVPTATAEADETVTCTATPTCTPTITPVMTETPTPSPTAAMTISPTQTVFVTETPTMMPSPTETPTAHSTSTPTATSSATPTMQPTSEPTATITATITSTPVTTPAPTPTATPTLTPVATDTPEIKRSPTPGVTPSATPSATPTEIPDPTPTPRVDEDGTTWYYQPHPKPPEHGAQPKMPGEWWHVLDGYDTPLGVVVLINHCGDCFD